MKTYAITLSILTVIGLVFGLLYRNGYDWAVFVFIPLVIVLIFATYVAHRKGVI